MKKAQLKKLKKKILMVFPAGMVAMGAMLFLPAGTLYYWHAWILMGILLIPCVFIVTYLFRHDPELLERRMRYKEKENSEKTVIKISQLLFLIGILIAGLDHRFGWSNVPVWLVITADAIVFLGYMLVFLVFRENTYTSRIVEVEKEQKVISTGPYAKVRHPMYAGVVPMYIAFPVALGSYYALILFLPVIAVIVFRIFDEERILLKGLKGYRQYCKKVRYRLIPGIW